MEKTEPWPGREQSDGSNNSSSSESLSTCVSFCHPSTQSSTPTQSSTRTHTCSSCRCAPAPTPGLLSSSRPSVRARGTHFFRTPSACDVGDGGAATHEHPDLYRTVAFDAQPLARASTRVAIFSLLKRLDCENFKSDMNCDKR